MHVDENSKSFVDVISTNLSPKPYVDVTSITLFHAVYGSVRLISNTSL